MKIVGRSPRHCLTCALLTFVNAHEPAMAIDSLVVGRDISRRGWRNIAAWGEVSHVTVKYDSVFKWNVDSHANLAAVALEHGGRISGRFNIDDTTEVQGIIPGLERLIDSDPGSAFDPDEAELDGINVSRALHVDLDLGAAFQIGRIRLFPRLDRSHILAYPQVFAFASSAEPGRLVPISPISFGSTTPNRQPVVDKTFASRNTRYIQLTVDGLRPWELAELEIYSDGTVPPGLYTATPQRSKHPYPVWGKVRYDGGDVVNLPVTIQTRTGPDGYPVQYFRLTGIGDDLELVAAGTYNALPPEEQGPVRSNPAWNNWHTLNNGIVRSPGPNRYLQFRVLFSEPGTILENLIFEYAQPPVVSELLAEIDPRRVAPGTEQQFKLSLVSRMLTSYFNEKISTGYHRVRVITDARVTSIDSVLLDDVDIPFSASLQEEGFTVSLGRRINQDGSFLQLVFRAAVFRDGTQFEVHAVDRRVVNHRLETIYQVAFPEDVDPRSLGGDLAVRLEDSTTGLLINLDVAASFTPNGDGINDVWKLAYDLLRLTAPAQVRLDLFDLAGQSQLSIYHGALGSGHYEHLWDGTDSIGRPLPPGAYLYRLSVVGEGRSAKRGGIVVVAY